jgi:hypothetical protein
MLPRDECAQLKCLRVAINIAVSYLYERAFLKMK